MGVKIHKRGGKWYVFVNYHGRRKAKCVGSNRHLAEQVKLQIEARLALGDATFLVQRENRRTFAEYAQRWLKEYAETQCKPSTCRGYPYSKSCGYWEFLKFERKLQDDKTFVAMTR